MVAMMLYTHTLYYWLGHHGSIPRAVLVLGPPLMVVPTAALLWGGVGGGECACCFWN